MQKGLPEKINVKRLCEIASKSIKNGLAVSEYCKDKSPKNPLPLFDCFIAPCRQLCPIHQDVPTYIRSINENHHDRALESIMIQNPLPNITGHICDHQCITRCTRRFYDESVKIRDLKLIAAETGFQKCSHPVKSDVSPNGIKIAVIGAGPAGLSAGYFLVRAGFSVTIFDRNPAAGGTVRFVIPGFRLPEEAILNDIAFIEKTGVKFQFGVSSDLSVEQLKKQGYRYIFLAIGAGKSNPLVLPGENKNLIDAIDFLRTFRNSPIKVRLGKTVVVIGGGNSAMDAARAAKKVDGVQNVTIIYRRTISEMPADREEIENAVSDGVIIYELLAPAEFSRTGILKCQKIRLGEPDDSGRRRPIPIDGKFEDIQADFIISAIGENVETEFLRQSGVDIDRRGNVVADPLTNETNIPGVFIGGDARLGPATVVEAIAEGNKVAAAIILQENPTYKEPASPRQLVDLNEIYQRKGLLKSAEKDLNDPDCVRREASRCLDCQTYCGICVDVCPNRANFAVKSETGWQIVHIDGLCNECGNCATFCPWNGKPNRDKFTVFWNEQDFTESESDGVLFVKNTEDPTFRLRLNSCEEIARLSDLCRISNSPESATALNLVKSIWDGYRFLLEN
jgi:putative selenate reductase